MTRVFVYEWTCANPGAVAPGSSLFVEGAAMRTAAIADFAALPDVVAFTIDDEAEYRAAVASADFALVIAPETDGILEARCLTAQEVGTVLLGPPPEAVALTADKLALSHRWQAAGVLSPPTYAGAPPLPPPWLVKPRDGCGSHRVALAHTVPDKMIAQPFIRGVAASVAFIIGERDLVALAPTRQQLTAGFRYRGGSAPLSPPFAFRANSIARRAVEAVPGLAGYVGVDVVLGDDGRDWAIEINPRLTTSYLGLRALSEDNLAGSILSAARCETVHAPRWREGSVAWTADGRYVHSPRSTE